MPQSANSTTGQGPDLTVTDGTGGLSIINLRKSYKRRPVIRDVSLQLNRGEVVALLGPNGSGKTTTFYAIAGLVTPEGGQVLIDGRDVTTLPMYQRARLGVGYLPQEPSIFRGLTVEQNVYINFLSSLNCPFDRKQIEYVCDMKLCLLLFQHM